MAGYPASDALAPIIAEGRGVSDKASFLALKQACVDWKADDYDAHQLALRHYYEGHIAPHLMLAATQRFPHSAKKMPMVALNWARLYAQNAAAVYDYPAQRFLTRDGDKLDPDAADELEDEQDEKAGDPNAEDPGDPGDLADTADPPSISPDDIQRCEDFADMVKEAHLDVVMAEAERRVRS